MDDSTNYDIGEQYSQEKNLLYVRVWKWFVVGYMLYDVYKMLGDDKNKCFYARTIYEKDFQPR